MEPVIEPHSKGPVRNEVDVPVMNGSLNGIGTVFAADRVAVAMYKAGTFRNGHQLLSLP